MIQVGRFKATTFEELFQGIKNLPWEEYIPEDGKFWVKKASSINSKLFSPSDIADLSTDGCFTLGCAVCATVTLAGHPVLGLFAAAAAGVVSGFVTAFLQTRMGIQSILAGIIVNTGLYTINIAVMGFASNMNLFSCDTVFSWAKDHIGGTWYKLIVAAVFVVTVFRQPQKRRNMSMFFQNWQSWKITRIQKGCCCF